MGGFVHMKHVGAISLDMLPYLAHVSWKHLESWSPTEKEEDGRAQGGQVTISQTCPLQICCWFILI